MNGIYFPGFGINLSNVTSGFTIFGFRIAFYGVIIALGFGLALLLCMKEAKRSGQNEEDYLDFLLVMIIPVIVGLRLYYVLFNLDEYTKSGKSFGGMLLDMINLRHGGLAIYGGIIAGVITGIIFTRKRKLSLPLFGDTISMGLLLGQIMGRWGNFLNREAFGVHTTSAFRMAIPVDYFRNEGLLNYYTGNGIINEKMLENTEMVKGIECITVHPTFLYESMWNLALLIFIFCFRKHKKFDGELAMIYIAGYGIGRFIVEGFRTDSLMIGPFRISQLVGLACFFVGAAVIVYNLVRIKKGHEPKLNLVK